MLNPAFSAQAQAQVEDSFVLPTEIAELITESNQSGTAGAELRLQRVYGAELWSRLRSLRIGAKELDGQTILDACCGAGFLSYHLLKRVTPRALTLVDISEEEVHEAELLLTGDSSRGGLSLEFRTEDLASSGIAPESFDIVIGNSFLHHFPDVPTFLAQTLKMLRPGGMFIGLHEPAPAAIVWESGHLRPLLGFLSHGEGWIDTLRPDAGIATPGSGDVWLFNAADIATMLRDAGFVDVRVRPRYLLRPLLVALLQMHLTPMRPRLSWWQRGLLRAAVASDAALASVAPSCWFGGVCFCACRPAVGSARSTEDG